MPSAGAAHEAPPDRVLRGRRVGGRPHRAFSERPPLGTVMRRGAAGPSRRHLIASVLVRPLDEQTILITGSTDGLGEATAETLARRGGNVLVHGRSEQKLERALAKLGADRGAPARGLLADLGSLEQVRLLARCVERDVERLDVLVNNAGVAVMDERRDESKRIRAHLRGQLPLPLPADGEAPSVACGARRPLASSTSPPSGRRRSTSMI